MPGAGPDRLEFVGKEPLIFRALVVLLFANTVLLLGLDFGAKYVLTAASANIPPCQALASGGVGVHAPGFICWYASHGIAIQFILLGLIGLVMLAFRKRVRYVYRGQKFHP
jgi:hypothetical protein